MLLLKPGYAPLHLYNQLRSVPTLAEASRWEYEGKTVKMKKATDDEIRSQGYLVSTSFRSRRRCCCAPIG